MKHYICPLCNGLQSYTVLCEKCAAPMKDGGKVSDYFSPYAPYIPDEMTDQYEIFPYYCTHLFFCENCGYDERISILSSIEE